MNELKLTIEMVPASMWYSNVRSEVPSKTWNLIRSKCYEKAGNVCEICGDVGQKQGVKHSVECHEIWEYDDANLTQILKGFVALCPRCHKVKHAGLASVRGKLVQVIKHLMKVNSMTDDEAVAYVDDSFRKWYERSKKTWKLDVTYIDEYLKHN